MTGNAVTADCFIAPARRRLSIVGLCAAVGGALGGCAELTSIYHSRSIEPTPRAITTDAYQRSVFIVPEAGTTGSPKAWRVCAEAAPDTFAALSGSLAGSGDAKEQRIQLAAAIAQSGATIERTQTVNLLRESLYRTCERYLSGAISKPTLIVQAARDQRAMVTVLAIEQLTRAIRPAATIISAGPTSATVPNTALVELVTDLRKEEKDAATARGEAVTAFGQAGGPAACAGPRPTDEAGAVTPALWDACEAAEATLAARDAALATASGRVEKALALSGNAAGGSAVGATTGAGSNSGGGGGESPSQATLQAVATAIVEITNAPTLNETLMFCIAYLDVGTQETKDDVRQRCLAVLQQRANFDIGRLQGQTFDFSVNPIGSVGDTAGPALLTYLGGVTGAALDRRFELAVRAMANIGRPGDRQAVTALVTAPSNEDRTALRAALCELESDGAGRAALQCP